MNVSKLVKATAVAAVITVAATGTNAYALTAKEWTAKVAKDHPHDAAAFTASKKGQIVNAAKAVKTTPLDASAFVLSVYQKTTGITLAKTIYQQSQTGVTVKDKTALVPGDLVFFHLTGSGKTPTFVGIYTGKGNVTARTTKGVRTFSLNDLYWKNKFVYGKRIF
ncbi:NlpC/P60 family protein [Aneurinibacillus sp. Ricciae_BoGa-3]|uniref:NlpC/P60 family protein n=1 Tax=Aneurinibacillus sp. Ricciae_BoGa-3 TaxID=3022697 RepID=UPI002341A23A|nr:NlpC/P60 family protein [Aneurinibacillus sp. Ricciae_BoGa-3]WCK55481.1 NlpC/P60 family protein [Aneurinibacillus sp. Ricciae_BoGa-3]